MMINKLERNKVFLRLSFMDKKKDLHIVLWLI